MTDYTIVVKTLPEYNWIERFSPANNQLATFYSDKTDRALNSFSLESP